jgi:hypothetical protein
MGARVISATYSIEGALTYEGHGIGEPPGYKGKIFKKTFHVSVDDSKWTVKMIDLENTNFSYFLSTYDGTNIIYLDRLSLGASNFLHNKLPTGVTNMFQSCTVESAPVPRAITSVANAYPWLAFASGCYLRSVVDGKVWDMYPLSVRNGFFFGRRQIPCRFTLSAVPPYLPTWLECKWTNIMTMSRDGKISGQDLPPVFGGSFVTSELKSYDFTNVDGLSFPTKFEVKEYRPMPDATNANDFRCTLIVKGAVTSISATSQIWSNELPNETLAVYDYRLYTNAPVSCYQTSNGIIPLLDDPRLASAKQDAWQRVRATENAAVQRRDRAIHAKPGLVRILLGVIATTPILLLYRYNKINKQKDDKL